MKKNTIYAIIIIVLILILGILIYFMTNQNVNSNNSVTITSNKNSDGSCNLDLDNSNWNYDETNNVYYKIGVVYCSNPETTDYESLGIYVPGDYFRGTKNSDGTYTVTLNIENKVGNYTSKTAPIVMLINTAGYSAQTAPSSYSYNGMGDYLEAGFVYVYAGCRGRYESSSDYSQGAPWGVTDLKAAVRYLRYNKENLPGDTDTIFTFGHSGGGAQSSLMGATGDSELYKPYLESIGAAMSDKNGNNISDSIAGAMCWCPITNLDIADEAYEWNMGQYQRSENSWTSALSKDLSKEYATYINELGLKDEEGNKLYLNQIKSADAGIYTSGTYYDYVLKEIEKSLNNFLSDTTFPYTPSNNTKADGGFGGNGAPGMTSRGQNNSKSSSSTTYNTAEEYIKSLNSDEEWITYDSSTNTAKITSIEAFVNHCKSASKTVGAFDSFEYSQAENKLFGNDNKTAMHFDSIMSKLLKDNKENYSSYSDFEDYSLQYEEDLSNKDKLGNDVLYRSNMYNPMYYICDYYEGYNTSKLAKYWRINTGITQGDTANVTEINLALALKNNSNVKSVDFATVWGQGHTTAERTGDSTDNFIEWVNDCLK